MYLTEKNLQKLIDEGFVKGEALKLEISAHLHAYVSTEAVYGGGLNIPYNDLTFEREGRRQTISCDLCEILESWRFKVNNKKVKITIEVVEDETE